MRRFREKKGNLFLKNAVLSNTKSKTQLDSKERIFYVYAKSKRTWISMKANALCKLAINENKNVE